MYILVHRRYLGQKHTSTLLKDFSLYMYIFYVVNCFSSHSWISYFWDKVLNKKIPTPPTARVRSRGTPIDSTTSAIPSVLSALPRRDPLSSRRILLRLSIWCMIWRCDLPMRSTCSQLCLHQRHNCLIKFSIFFRQMCWNLDYGCFQRNF